KAATENADSSRTDAIRQDRRKDGNISRYITRNRNFRFAGNSGTTRRFLPQTVKIARQKTPSRTKIEIPAAAAQTQMKSTTGNVLVILLSFCRFPGSLRTLRAPHHQEANAAIGKNIALPIIRSFRSMYPNNKKLNPKYRSRISSARDKA